MKDKSEIFGLFFFLFIALAAIGGGIYQLYKGYVKVGYNSRGGVGVNYGGTAIFMGLLLLWMAYLEWKRMQRGKK